MVTYMNDKKIQSLDDVRTFLAGTLEMEFSIPDKAARYRWIEQTLRRFRYRTLGRPERGVILRYVARVSGYSRPTVTRLVAQYGAQGTLQRRHRTVAGFVRYYSDADTRLLAELDELHGTPCGAAAKKLCERMCRIHGDLRYAALSHISVSHLYNLRKAKGYQRQRRRFDKTRPSRSTIAVRRQPEPQGKPGYLRLDTVHQGDLDGIKGVYHINAVDAVTQFQCVFSVERISERFLLPVLAALLETFPFVIHGFHADNGSEYINHRVAALLKKLTIEFTKSRPHAIAMPTPWRSPKTPASSASIWAMTISPATGPLSSMTSSASISIPTSTTTGLVCFPFPSSTARAVSKRSIPTRRWTPPLANSHHCPTPTPSSNPASPSRNWRPSPCASVTMTPPNR